MYLGGFQWSDSTLEFANGRGKDGSSGIGRASGVIVLAGHLYVTDMGNLCDLAYVIHAVDDEPAERNCWQVPNKYRTKSKPLLGHFLTKVSARILSYQIDASGGLSNPQIVADELLTFRNDHAPHGFTTDGEYVYASIGHPYMSPIDDPTGEYQAIVNAWDLIAASGGRLDLMGAIVRFRPGDTELEIYATGLRNTYGISMAPDGVIYGADNDQRSQQEELNAIMPGGYYGYPAYGTNQAPPDANVIEPVAVLAGVSSTAAYANTDGIYLTYIADGDNGGPIVERFDYASFTPQRIFSGGGLITAILERDGRLYLVEYGKRIYIIDPDAAPVRPPPAASAAP